jgi:hypothetical protein
MSYSKTHGVWWVRVKHGFPVLCGDAHVKGSSSCQDSSINLNQLYPPPWHCGRSVDANSTHILHFWTISHQVMVKSVFLASLQPRVESAEVGPMVSHKVTLGISNLNTMYIFCLGNVMRE